MATTKLLNTILIFLFGGIGYNLIEIIWRGYTHISMTIAGGLCFFIMFLIKYYLPHKKITIRALLSALFITTIELIFGIVFNIILGMNVWDYSNAPLNILGQICLPYTALWFVISITVQWGLDMFFKSYLYGEKQS